MVTSALHQLRDPRPARQRGPLGNRRRSSSDAARCQAAQRGDQRALPRRRRPPPDLRPPAVVSQRLACGACLGWPPNECNAEVHAEAFGESHQRFDGQIAATLLDPDHVLPVHADLGCKPCLRDSNLLACRTDRLTDLNELRLGGSVDLHARLTDPLRAVRDTCRIGYRSWAPKFWVGEDPA